MRWMRMIWLAALVLAGGVCGCGREAGLSSEEAPAAFVAPALSGAAALEEVRQFVELGPKEPGTPGAERAAQYLAERLERLGVAAEIQEFRDASPIGELTFRNVIGRIPGADAEGRILMLGAHYDTKIGIPDFQGANDSGSGVGLLFEIVRALKTAEALPLDIWVVFFDGEECRETYGPNDGFHGSRHLAKTMAADGMLKDIAALILLDMVGDRDLTVTIPRNSTPWLTSLVFDAARAEGTRKHFQLYPYPIADDHIAFFERGIPAIDLIDFQFGSAPGLNDYWHTAEDSMDKVSAESLAIVGNVVLRMIPGIAAR